MYQDGTYLRANPEWHSHDSPWKAGHIAAMLQRHALVPASVCEVGCGAGEILCELAKRLPAQTSLVGYEISPDAYRICSAKANERVRFRLENLVDQDVQYDVLLAIDVLEHVEDYFTFLRAVRTKARHKIFHIPLELSAQHVLRGAPLMRARRTVGHLHHFMKETALATLIDCGYSVRGWSYTSILTEVPGHGWKSQLLRWPRKLMHRINADVTARALGGYSLLVLAE